MIKQIRTSENYIVSFDTKNLILMELYSEEKKQFGKIRNYYNIAFHFKNPSEMTSFVIYKGGTPSYPEAVRLFNRLFDFIYKSEDECIEVYLQKFSN